MSIKKAIIPTLLFMVFLFVSKYADAVISDSCDILAYKINVVVKDDGIEETVTVDGEAKKPLKELSLELADTMEVESCRMNDQDIPFKRDGWKMDLDLDKVDAPKGAFSIAFKVKGKPYTKFSESRGGFVRTDVGPEHAYIRSQYAWYPRVEDDPAVYETTVSVDKERQVRTAGELSEKTEDGDRVLWKFVLDKPDRRIGLVADAYVLVERATQSGISLDAMVIKGHEEGGKFLLESAAKALDYYASVFGKVPNQRFTLVEMPTPFGPGSGYGETGYTMIGTGAFEQAGQSPWAEALVVHEVAHTWWGHEVGFQNFASEAFATYATHRYIEEMQGEDAALKERESFVREIMEAHKKEEIALDTIRDWGAKMDPGVYRANAYSRGAMILHIAEQELGRKKFDSEMKKFFEKYRGQVIDYSTVCKDLCGSKGKWIFEQWGGSELPQLREEHEVKKTGSSYSVKGTLYQEGTEKPFKMSVCLRAVAGSESVDEEVNLSKDKAAFRFSCPFEPEKLLLDPDRHLFFKMEGIENVKELIDKAFGVSNNPGEYDEKKLLKAIGYFEKLIDGEGAKKSECLAGMGRCLFRLGKTEEARAKLEEAVGMGDSGPFWRGWIWLRLGCIADLDKKRSDAEGYYRKVLDLPDAGNLAYQKKLAQQYLDSPFKGER